MIELSGAQVRLLRENISRCLTPLLRGRTTPICIESGPGGLIVRAKNEQAAIEWRLAGTYSTDRLVITLDALKRLPHGKSQVVSLESAGEQSVLARWTEKKIPQSIECWDGEFADDFPSVPEQIAENEPRLISALRDAGEVVDSGNNRYALECLHFLASEGRLAATDGRQALVQRGFTFPWEGELLVRSNRVFAGSEFTKSQPVQIGKSDDWLTLICGNWNVHLAIVKDGRFPDLNRVIPEVGTETAAMQLTEEDAQFFIDAADRLPAADEAYSPLTVDLNGHVTLCARDAQTNRATALVLSNSRWSGEALRFHTDRRYLQRATRLGMRNVCFPGPDGVAWCRDAQRTYLWMSLAKELAVNPEQCVERVDSPVSATSTIAPSSTSIDVASAPSTATPASAQVAIGSSIIPNPLTCEDTLMKSSQTSDADRTTVRTASSPSSESSRGAALVTQVDSLRTTLAQALGQVRELGSALRRRQKQSRLVETTLASLRQLKEVEV